MAQMQVFLSHSSADKDIAERVVVALRGAGADVWFDEHNLGATQLLDEIMRQLRARPVFIVLLSEHAFASDWVKRECKWAWNIQRRDPSHIILPVVISPIDPGAFDTMLFLDDFWCVEGPNYTPYPEPEMIVRMLRSLSLTPVEQRPTTEGPQPTDSVPGLITRGLALADQKRWAEALPFFQSAVRRSPRKVTAWANLGWVYGELGQYAEELNATDRALALNDQEAWLWSNRGYVLDRLERYEEALEACNQALALDPNDAYSWNNQARALNNLKRYEEALAASEHTLAIDSNQIFAWGNKARALVGLRRYREALAASEQALTLNQNYPNAWRRRGQALSGLRHYEEALASYDRALTTDESLHPLDDRAGVLRGKAKVLNILGRTAEAEEAERRAKELGGEGGARRNGERPQFIHSPAAVC